MYNIPKDCEELFLKGNASYSIIDDDEQGDNIFAMKLFLELVGVPDEYMELDDGTMVILSDGKTKLRIDSGGLGDYSSHGYDVAIIPDEPEPEVGK